ncbi:MAG: DUF302 domain-containing protein [Pseudomonadota bacterium]
MRRFLFSILLSLMCPAVLAAEGLVTLSSSHSVSETVDRLEQALTAQGFRIFARVDHGAGAAGVDMDLPPTELLIFGKPQAGTLLMQAERTVGIDLPLKYLVWEDENGDVAIGWNDASWVAERHEIYPSSPVVVNVTAALRKFAEEVAQ